jgi:LPXTG-motif cell wall-anchored protein
MGDTIFIVTLILGLIILVSIGFLFYKLYKKNS